MYPFISMLNSNICPFVNVMPTDQKSFLKAQLCRLTPFIFSIFPRFHSSSSALGIPLKANKEFPWESPVYKEQIFSGTFLQLTKIAVRLGFKQRHNCSVFFSKVYPASGKPATTKTDEFSEKFQTAFDPQQTFTQFLATLVALRFTPVSKSVSRQSFGRVSD